MSDSTSPVKSILIIDDEPDILDILKSSLESDHVTILTADNGKMGLEMVRKHHPSAIISDYNMPHLNGLELLKSMNEESFSIPVIWTTGYASVELQRQAWGAGVYDIIEKPFNMEHLKKCVTEAMSSASPKKEDHQPYFITKLMSRQVRLAIDAKHYDALNKLCESKNISITTFINQLIEAEVAKKKAA